MTCRRNEEMDRYRQIDNVNKKSAEKRVFSRMRRSVTIESIRTKFLHIDSLGSIVIYLAYRNCFTGFEGVECEIWPLPFTLALASNTAYCATSHTPDTN